jgi:hypothetical protein
LGTIRYGAGVFVAHEQLQQNALRMLGSARVLAYRYRLHTWADRYAERGWPVGTPEYLLRGYFRLLRETRDVARLVGCALDRRRTNGCWTSPVETASR